MYQPWMTEVTGKFVLRKIAFLALLRYGVINQSPYMIRRTEKKGEGAISNLKEVPTAQRASRDERAES